MTSDFDHLPDAKRHELAFVAFDTQVSNADDHTLYMSYLLREAKAPPAPDAPAGTGDTGSSDGG